MTNAASQPSNQAGLEPHQIELDKKRQLLSKVRVVRQSMLDRAADLRGTNPAKHYVWVNVREERQSYYQAWGYTIVKDPAVLSPFKQEDGTHKRADVILYEIDKDFAEAVAADNQIRGLEAVGAASENFISGINSQGVPAYIPR